MVKTSKVIVLVVTLALLAASAFAAPSLPQPQLPAAAPLVSKAPVDDIFAPLPGAQVASAGFVIRGVCSFTCLPCYGSCSPDPETGIRQTCVNYCP